MGNSSSSLFITPQNLKSIQKTKKKKLAGVKKPKPSTSRVINTEIVKNAKKGRLVVIRFHDFENNSDESEDDEFSNDFYELVDLYPKVLFLDAKASRNLQAKEDLKVDVSCNDF